MTDHELSPEPHTIIVSLYEDVDGAKTALKSLKKVRKDKDIEITDAAILRKNEAGKIRVSETGDWSGKKGMVVGGIAGAAIGVITGGVGFLAVGGAAVAGLASRLRDSGFENDHLHAVTDQLTPDSSALLVVCATEDCEPCVDVVRESASELYVMQLDVTVTADLTIEQLQLGESIV